ncbi:META domain-containing protein [Nocardioides sp. MH1]|uniref:META domain-containing protein n=1 Tax=Nocardioides sp. MH1 TaxID=3242490 RepID=UPI003521D050
MTDDTEQRVIALIDRIPVAGAPVADLVREGVRTRQRRRTRWIAGGAGSLAVIGIVTAILMSGSDASRGRDPVPVASDSPTATSTTTTPAAPLPIVEGRWIVEALIGPGGKPVLDDRWRGQVWLKLENGHVTGDTGVNSIFGRYEQGGADGEDLVFLPDKLGTTLVGCTDSSGANCEPPLLDRLLAVRHVSQVGKKVYLHAESWMIVAVLRPAG